MSARRLASGVGAILLVAALGCTPKSPAKPGQTLSLKLEPAIAKRIYEKARRKVKRSYDEVSGQLPSGETFFEAKLTQRGTSDAESESRKSFNLGFSEPMRIREAWPPLEKVALLGLAEDPFLYRNLLGYHLYSLYNLFFSNFSVASFYINGLSRGVVLVVEPPEKALTRRFGEVSGVLRTNYADYGMLKVASNGLSEDDLRSAYERIQSALRDPKEGHLYNRLSQVMNVDGYLLLLAVNRLARNGDYTDEIFFGASKKEGGTYFGRYSQWDFENILTKPHHQHRILYAGGMDSLVFTGESRLDLAIANDCDLYPRYLSTLEETVARVDGPLRKRLESAVLTSLSEVTDSAALGYYQLSMKEITQKLSADLDRLEMEAQELRKLIPEQRKALLKRCAIPGKPR